MYKNKMQPRSLYEGENYASSTKTMTRFVYSNLTLKEW